MEAEKEMRFARGNGKIAVYRLFERNGKPFVVSGDQITIDRALQRKVNHQLTGDPSKEYVAPPRRH